MFPKRWKYLGMEQLLNRLIARCNITQRKQFTQVICIIIETTEHNKCYIFHSCSFIFNQGSCHNHKVFINFVGRLVRHIQLWHQVMEKHSPTAIKRERLWKYHLPSTLLNCDPFDISSICRNQKRMLNTYSSLDLI